MESTKQERLTVSLKKPQRKMIDELRGRESRSSFIRHLIEQAWAEFSKKEQE